MKKALLLLIAILVVLSMASCNNEKPECQHRDADDNSLCDKCDESYSDGMEETEHTHNFDKESNEESYLATPADCENAATYYYSCFCGEKGTETFTYGEPKGHGFTPQNTDSEYLATAANCQKEATYYYSCRYCGAKGTDTFSDGTVTDHKYIVENTDDEYVATIADCENAATYYYSCEYCEAKGTDTFTYGEPNGHSYSEEYFFDHSYHWFDCLYCDETTGYEAHTVDEYEYCDVCDKSVNVKYTSSGVSGYIGNPTKIIIADTYNGTPVTSIRPDAFKNCTSLREITISDNVKSIGQNAFSGCTNLTSATIGNGLVYIMNTAFLNCTNLTSVTIGSNVEWIGSSAFYGCTKLTSVIIPDSVKEIASYAFSGCSNLATINYRGTEEQWNAIIKHENWDNSTGNYTVIYNYTEE